MKIFFSLPEFDAQLLRTLSYTPNAGADLGECLTTAARIKEGDFSSWYEEWTHLADRVHQSGEASLQGQHPVSAREAFLRASNYYRTAVFFLYGAPVDPRLIAGYDKHFESFEKAIKLFNTPVKAIEIPYEGTTLPAHFYKSGKEEGPAPTIITGSGYDGTRQESYFSVAAGGIKRGYNVICFDGPGQGGVLIKQNIHMRPDWEKVITPIVDYVSELEGVDPEQLILIGSSWGGMLAPRAAAFEHRLAALVANPGQYNAMEPIKRFFPQVDDHLGKDDNDHSILNGILNQVLNDRMMAEKFHAKMWVHGVDTAFELLRTWKEYNLENVARNITCPTLVCDSENEHLSTGQAKELFAVLQCPKDYILFKNSEGAGEHCAAGAIAFCEQQIFDWLDTKIHVKALQKT